MEMPKSKYDQTKQNDAPRVAELQSVQDVISVVSIDDSGIFELPSKRFSKLYALSDINFAGVTDEEQKSIIINFSKVLKAIPCRFSYTVANEHVDERAFHEKVLYPLKGDKYDGLRRSYNKVIADKVSDAKQGLYQTIYLTLTIKAEDMADAKSTFASMESAIRSAFIGIGVNVIQGSVMRSVGIDERMQLLFNLMHSGMNHHYKFNFEKELKARHDWLNIVSPVSVCFENEDFSINGQVGRIYFVDEYPKSLESDIISALTKINCTSFVTVANELLDISGFKQEIARKYMAVGMKIENEKQRNRNNNDYLADASTKLLNEKEKLDAFSKALDTDDDHYFNSTMLIFVLTGNKDEMDQIEEKLMNAASLKSIRLKTCFGKQKEALNSVLPLGAQEFKRVVNLSSSCLAMLMPFKTQELNDENGIYYGINQLSQNVIFADKKLLKNHNGLILGQSGSGKSVFSKSEIISTFVNYEGDQIIIIDPQSEYGYLAEVVDGTVISFDSAKEFYLNPMDVDFEGVDYGRLQEIVAEKADFILTLLSSCLRRDILPEEQGVIDKVIEKVYSENYSMRKRLNGIDETESEYEIPAYLQSDVTGLLGATDLSNEEQIKAYSPTLQDVYQGLKDYGSDIGLHLAAAMEIFVNGSLNLFNHRTNVDLKNRFIVFDLSGLKENLQVTSMLIMMETVRSKIKANATKGRWTHLYIDEFHELLGVEQVANFVLKLWKEIRKMSGILNGITQNMTDLLNNENGGKLQAILSNTEYFALLSQSTLDKNKLMEFLPSISPAMFNFVDNADKGTGLLRMGTVAVPFDMKMSTESEIYKIVNTDGGGYGV
ncbi:AAA-like domain-containing protein [Lachnospiraceae bacterium C10]|nr:AAA-like domain-containing protein [Lachnospiraceae bacterium C10]